MSVRLIERPFGPTKSKSNHTFPRWQRYPNREWLSWAAARSATLPHLSGRGSSPSRPEAAWSVEPESPRFFQPARWDIQPRRGRWEQCGAARYHPTRELRRAASAQHRRVQGRSPSKRSKLPPKPLSKSPWLAPSSATDPFAGRGGGRRLPGSVARPQSARQYVRWGWKSEWGCTPANTK